MTGLSHIQKREISMAARDAYEAWPEREAYEAINSDVSRTKCFDAWRYVETGKAVGIQSLKHCTQAHYAPVLAHFQKLAGHVKQAERTRSRDASNGARIARYKLTQELRARGLGDDYAATICRNKFKCALSQASEKMLWSLYYDVKKRPLPTSAPVQDENPF